MTIEPQKSQTRADERRAKNCQLACAFDMRNRQIRRDFYIARAISKNEKNKCNNERATNRKSIETVCEIHRIRRADDCEDDNYNSEPRAIRCDRIFVKWHHDFRNQFAR